MKAFAVIALLLPSIALADFAECLLDRLPGTQNDVAANAIWQTCMARHPGGIASVGQGSGRGWLSFKSGAECTAKKAADTRSHRAAAMINGACKKLYDEPIDRDQFELIAPPRKPMTIDEFLDSAPRGSH